ncbi:MAG TPA: hypothetical protein V6D19_13710 [Stenomitos sp.]
MSRTLKLILIAFGWFLGLAASLCVVWAFLFGVRMVFVGDVAIGVKVIGFSLVFGWVLGVFKGFLERSWARIPIHMLSSSDSPKAD